MKITAGKAEAFLNRPDPSVIAILLYGPDQGLVGDRARKLVKSHLGADETDFALSTLTSEQLKSDPGLLVDEACAFNMLGGARCVRITQIKDEATAAVERLGEQPNVEALTIIEAGDLSTSSKLRKLVEKDKRMAAIGCYRDEGRGLENAIRSLGQDYGLTMSRDVVAYLAGQLGSDRGVTRSEIQKLALYEDAKPEQPKPVSIDSVRACIGDNAAIAIDQLIDRCFIGDAAGVMRVLSRMRLDQTSPISMLRPLQNHLDLLMDVTQLTHEGMSVEQAITKTRPYLHFRTKQALPQHLRGYTVARLRKLLDHALDTEIRMKSTGQPANLLFERLILTITRSKKGVTHA